MKHFDNATRAKHVVDMIYRSMLAAFIQRERKLSASVIADITVVSPLALICSKEIQDSFMNKYPSFVQRAFQFDLCVLQTLGTQIKDTREAAIKTDADLNQFRIIDNPLVPSILYDIATSCIFADEFQAFNSAVCELYGTGDTTHSQIRYQE
jgi:hypothetical protein